MPIGHDDLAACTIVAKNYLPFARVLARSFAEHHPGGRFFTLLADRSDGYFRTADEPFAVVELEELDNVRDLDEFLFKYSLLERSTAIKPYFLEHLFRKFELDNLTYLDPDILIFRPLSELGQLLDSESRGGVSIVLTPHLTEPLADDGAYPSERTVLRSGSFNLGFLGLRWTAVTERLLGWWQKHLYDRCLVRHAEGLFVDQRWMDLAPGLFGDVHVLTHPGYNVAYWNLLGREITRSAQSRGERRYLANGQPLAFFHFSGFDPHDLERVSKHQDRFQLSDLGAVGELYRRYRQLVLAAGWEECRGWPDAFGVFDHGVRIPEAARKLYHSLPPARRRRFGNPFCTAGAGSYLRWLNEPSEDSSENPPFLSRLLHYIWTQRGDLQDSFPDATGRHFTYLCSWLIDPGRYQLELDDVFLEHIHRESRATLLTTGGIRRRLVNRWQRLQHSPAGRQAAAAADRLLEHPRLGGVRRRLRRNRRPPNREFAATLGPDIPLPKSLPKVGINLIGHLSADTGAGEAARALARSLGTTGIPVALRDLDLEDFASARSACPYDVNLLVVDAEEVCPVFERLGGEVFGKRCNVGFLLWERERFPDAHRGAFDPLHEVWTPSALGAGALSDVSPLPVRRVPRELGSAAVGRILEQRFQRLVRRVRAQDLPADADSRS